MNDAGDRLTKWRWFTIQITVTFLVGVVLIASILTYLSINRQTALLEQSLIDRGEGISRSLANAAVVPLLLQDRAALEQLGESFLEVEHVKTIQIVDRQGTSVLRRGISMPASVDKSAADELTGLNVLRHGSPAGKSLFVISFPIFSEPDAPEGRTALGLVRIGLASDWIERASVRMIRTGILVSGGLIAVVVGIGAFLIYNMTRRMRDLVGEAELARRLKEANRDLAQSNSELEQFAYVVSHDLQEPLRKIINFTELLEQRYADLLEDKAEHYMDRVVNAARRMRTMIEDLLRYSRVGRTELDYETVDLNRMIDEIREDYSLKLEETDGTIQVGDMPRVGAVPGLIRQVFQNLIANAIKYHGEQPPEIHVGVDRQDGNWLFSVADNGIGMEPDQQDRIFEVFQRLHTRQEYSGTGIGLAICKKVVLQHDGDLWVESSPGEGSTFYFTLPVKPSPRPVASTTPGIPPAPGE